MTDDSKNTITPERWHRSSEIFADALEHGEGRARDAFLLQACADDHALLQQVRGLIDAEARSPNALGMTQFAQVMASAVGATADEAGDSAEHWIGQRLGAYKIVSEIARGGMGLVFKGHRDDAEFSKDVAIKLVRGGGDHARLIERFKAERQILATLDHPNIARLIDGGTTADGWPFLVMEFVDGEPITTYAARHSLDVNARLDLFRSVCAAVHFAHQRLVVHRDLKPSNIFVNQHGEVKLLDFGIAKMLEAPAAAGTPDAATTLLAMTPAYASPEQIRNEPITTASDVYALGVVLYELLTGQSPYKANKTQPLDLAKEICETDPERPSTVVGRTDVDASNPRTPGIVALDLKRLQRGLRGDLDNIVMMALRKDPARRYASAEQLSEDIRRYRDDQPVSARTDTWGYRASKFVTRNRWAVGFAVLAGSGLIGGIVATSHQANVARQAQARAEQAAADIRKLANDSLFELHESIKDLPGATAARQQLIERAIAYLEKLSAQPQSDAALAEEIGWGWLRLAELQAGHSAVNTGQISAAEGNYKKAVATLAAAHAKQPAHIGVGLRLAMAHRGYGVYLATLNKQDDAAREFAEAIAVGERFDDKRIETGRNRVEITSALLYRANYIGAGDAAGLAVKVRDADRARQILEAAVAQVDTPDEVRKRAESNLAYAYQTLGFLAAASGDLGRNATALAWAQKSAALEEQLLAKEPHNTLRMFNTANAYGAIELIHREAARYEEAVDYGQRAYALFDRVSMKDAADNGAAISKLFRLAYVSISQLNLGRLADAEKNAALARKLWIALSAENQKVSIAAQGQFVVTVAEARIDARHANERGVGESERVRLCTASATRFRAAQAHLVAQGANNSFGEGIFGPNDASLEDLRVCGSAFGEMQALANAKK